MRPTTRMRRDSVLFDHFIIIIRRRILVLFDCLIVIIVRRINWSSYLIVSIVKLVSFDRELNQSYLIDP